jgi:serine/tyrosine/threonine adenylyltransferase
LSKFSSTYTQLPSILYRPTEKTSVVDPSLAVCNANLAVAIGVSRDLVLSIEGLQVLSGNSPLLGIPSVAMAYAGHQFGQFVPLLGDGRAKLIGEIVGPDGVRRDLHLKGSGRTAYSRGGDGRATLGAMLREYIVSEAMAALGIPTTRALAVVKTGEMVAREKLEPGAVLTRVACSHVRVGTFQFLAVREEFEAMRQLADYEMARNFPGAATGENRFLWFLSEVIARQASLISQWMCVGFIHGVMNTDNMSVCGETIDYGPCAFIDVFHPQKVFSSIDRNGRYAWDKQPIMVLWNLTRLAEAMLPLFDTGRAKAIELAEAELQKFMPAFELTFEKGMAHKFGFAAVSGAFIAETLQELAECEADFTQFFSALSRGKSLHSFLRDEVLWKQKWHSIGEPDFTLMQKNNPNFIARNHQVEKAIQAANVDDLGPLHRLLKVVQSPFELHEGCEDLMAAPLADEVVQKTFCGT